METYATVDLTSVGAYIYWAHPDTGILVISYTFDQGATMKRWHVWLDEPMPADLDAALNDPDCIFEGWNAAFERLGCRHGLKREIPIRRFRCTMARARSMALPGKLELCAKALKIPNQKQDNSIMMKWCKPLLSGGWADDEGEYRKLCEYCDGDVLAEIGAGSLLRDLSEDEWEDYWLNEEINDRGLPLDMNLVRAAQNYAADETAEINARVSMLTKGIVTTVKQHQRIKDWLKERLPPGMELKPRKGKISFDRNVREFYLSVENEDVITGDLREFVQLVHDGGRASTAKFASMQARTGPDDRLRGAYVFSGAGQTGRFCVAAETRVEIVNGTKRICDVAPGDMVWTHEGRLRPVVNVFYKGEDTMYRVTFDGGAYVIGTANHRILTTDGWRHVREFFGSARDGAGDLRAVHATALSYYGADSEGVSHDIPQCVGGAARRAVGGRDQETVGREQIALEKGREKPAIRDTEKDRGDLASRVFGNVERSRIHADTSVDDVKSAGLAEASTPLAGSPHRRGSDEQHVGQFRALHGIRPWEASRCSIEKIEAVGSRGVWDIEVAEDHSYAAQGLIHHNSSTGAQTHNFIRKKLSNIELVVEKILSKAPKGDVIKAASFDDKGVLVFDDGAQIAKPYDMLTIMSRTLRPSIVAPVGRSLVWGDWSSIEAVVLPWLSNENSASRVLEVYASGEDLYRHQALDTFSLSSIDQVTKDQRQACKVQILSLGFGGGVGAFQAMARNYGLRVDDATADQYKLTWRLSNPWAQRFWNRLETAAFNAVRTPETVFEAGRVSYFYAQGSLWCVLPSGRTLCYPFAQLETVEDRFGTSLKVTAIKGSFHPAADSDDWPRMTLWGGFQAENVTQGEAASLLRYARRESYACDWYQIGDTHDELLWEVLEHEEKQAKDAMLDIMTVAPDWAAGLPLRAEIKSGVVYGT